MKLLVDTDAFCKLGMTGLLQDAALTLGAELGDIRRLPALPHMLRRGSLRKRFGAEACDGLIAIAESMPIVAEPSVVWLEKFTAIDAIDPGEAQLFAVAAESGVMVLSGDKRALAALKAIAGVPAVLAGRIVVLEAVLLALCERLGADEVRRRVMVLARLDKVVGICFSAGNPDPQEALRSYYKSVAAEVEPLVLWDPVLGNGS